MLFNMELKKMAMKKILLIMMRWSKLAKEHKPKIIIAGASAYPRVIDWKKFKVIANSVGAYFMVDMAHYSGSDCWKTIS